MALVTCLAILAGLPIPMWTATRDLVGAPSFPMMGWAVVAIAWAFSTILPLFYFAWWKNGGPVRVSHRVRWLIPVGVVCGIALLATEFPISTLATWLSALGTLSCVVLLVVLFRETGEAGPVAGFFRSMMWVAVAGGVIWFLINLLSLISNPTAGAFRTLLEQICLFTPPVMVFGSRPTQ